MTRLLYTLCQEQGNHCVRQGWLQTANIRINWSTADNELSYNYFAMHPVLNLDKFAEKVGDLALVQIEMLECWVLK